MPVFADQNMLETAIRNLFSNAIKYSFPRGEINIKANLDNESILISVKDSGLGVKSEDLHRIFKIDHNFTTPGTNNEKGTGLGLILL